MNCICLKLGEKKSLPFQAQIYKLGYDALYVDKKKKARFPYPMQR
jgi:hypothetical protein